MKPRLDILLRQRELLREHAAWLDEEIAREQEATPATAVESVSAVPVKSSAPAAPTEAPQMAPAALPEPDIKGLHSEVRRGCMMYFVIAAAGLAVLIGFIYWRY